MKGTSKYLGKTIQGWKVVDRKVTTYDTCMGTHSVFTLKKKKGLKIYTMTLSDREMTQVTKHGKSIEDTIKGKASPVQKNLNRLVQNAISINTSLFNIFRTI